MNGKETHKPGRSNGLEKITLLFARASFPSESAAHKTKKAR